jgi:putative ABC transport system ATP-binding protein
MLELNSLSRSFNGRVALHSTSLSLRDGEYVAIIGESGVGKSTLLNLIAGLDRADHGTIVLDGENLVRLDEAALTRWRRNKLGFIFQAFHILPHLTLLQNVVLPLWLQGNSGADADNTAQQMLDAVGLGERTASWPHELSGGELQAGGHCPRAGSSSAPGAGRRADRQSRPGQCGARPRPAR